MLLFSREAARRVDRAALLDYGVPGVVLMENAAAALEAAAERMLRGGAGPAVILCGPGNNGGDGYALARRLHNRGVEVCVAMSGPAPASEVMSDAAINLRIIQCMRLTARVVDAASPESTLDGLCASSEPRLVVDALLGTGMRTPAQAPMTGMIRWINRRRAAGALVLAVDVPTGLDCDTGLPMIDPAVGEEACVVRADATVTFVGMKSGFLAPSASAYLGEVTVGDIGAPRELLERLGVPMPA